MTRLCPCPPTRCVPRFLPRAAARLALARALTGALTGALAGGWAGSAAADANIGGKTVECYCTDRQGARVELGQFTCLEVDGRRFTAQCQMSLNVPMWREVAQECLSSEDRSQPGAAQPSL